MNDFFVHPSSEVNPKAQIGSKTKIWHFCHVMNAVIGSNCILGQNVFVANEVKIGSGVKIQNNVSVYAGVEIEDDVFLGPSMVFTNVINPRSFVERKDEFKKTIVKKGASIGANATILCGVTIGQYALIGAGSVITKSIADYEVVTGNPANHHGWVSQKGSKLIFTDNKAACPIDNSLYTLVNNKVLKT